MEASAKKTVSVNTDRPVRVVMERHWTDWLKPVTAVLGLLLLAFFLLAPMPGFDGGPIEVTFDEWLTEREPVAADEETDMVGLVDLQGIIVTRDVALNELPDQAVITPEDVREQLANFHPDAGFKAVVLRVTTPGGMVTASDEIARIIAQYQEDVLPVYVYSDDLLASGGYYLAAAAKKIYAHKLATVGSIGVIYEIPNIESLAKDKLGVDLEVYKTGPFKDMNNPFRQRTAEEKRMIDLDLQENLAAFLAVLQEGRGFTPAEARRLATGQVWSGQKAVELKLVDKTVYGDQLADELRAELQTEKEIAFIRYDTPPSLVDEILSAAGVLAGRSPTEAVEKAFAPARAGSYYLYLR